MEMTTTNVVLALILLAVTVKLIVSWLEPLIRRRYPTPEGERPLPLSAIVLPILFGAVVGGAIANFLAKPDRGHDSDGFDFGGSDSSDSGSSGGDGGGGDSD